MTRRLWDPDPWQHVNEYAIRAEMERRLEAYWARKAPTQAPDWVSVAEAARRARVSLSTVYRWMHDGHVPTMHDGNGPVRVDLVAISVVKQQRG